MVSQKLIRKLMIAVALAVPAATLPIAQAHAGIFISVGFAPPALPVYVQPAIPGDGYIWTPGYWAYGDAGYFWVPGVWVEPPTVGLLWTPGYWGYAGGAYGWHDGYWGPHVGFYGGVNYGFGYGGIGFVGGEWRGGHFAYNSAVANFGSVHVTNVYVNRTVIQQNTIINNNHTSFNGGAGGINRTASPEEQRFAGENHVQPTANQMQHQNFAAQDRTQLASVNHGRPGTPAASNVNAYHQVSQQRAASQPISSADRSAGKTFNPSANQREAGGERSNTVNSGEAARNDQREANTDRPAANDRSTSGGNQNQQEHQQANHGQPQASHQPSNQNHAAPKPASKPAPHEQKK